MKEQNKLATYPLRFLTIAELAHLHKPVAPIQCPDERAAVSTRHLFNRFRRAMAQTGHPFTAAAADLIVRIEGTMITFTPRGLVSIEEAMPELQIENTAPLVASPLDEHDEAILKLLRGKKDE